MFGFEIVLPPQLQLFSLPQIIVNEKSNDKTGGIRRVQKTFAVFYNVDLDKSLTQAKEFCIEHALFIQVD